MIATLTAMHLITKHRAACGLIFSLCFGVSGYLSLRNAVRVETTQPAPSPCVVAPGGGRNGLTRELTPQEQESEAREAARELAACFRRVIEENEKGWKAFAESADRAKAVLDAEKSR